MRNTYTEEDINFLKTHYPIGDWDGIFNHFPTCTKSAIHKKCHRLGIRFDMTYKHGGHGLKKHWDEDEIFLLHKYYSIKTIDEMISILPGRNKNMIISKACSLGIPSLYFITSKWEEWEEKYIIKNWELTPDKIMADRLHRTFRSVKAKREQLGFFRQDPESSSYRSLSKYLRGKNQRWKKESMANCNYKCVLTGGKNFEIHHLYSVSNIINDIMIDHPEYKDVPFDKYSKEDLSNILSDFLYRQEQHPLGVCLDKKIHTLFHSMYGQYLNTEDQWLQFYNDFKSGLYNKYI